ncbi:hypothetical protein ACLB2K_037990 [Fragaria x ananassa]
MGLVKSATTNVGLNIEGGVIQEVRVPEPKMFNGERNTKVLENFIWDIKQYFRTTHIAEVEKVSIYSMYLKGDAKLWWRTKVQDAKENEDEHSLDSWDALKSEMLDIHNMAEEDKIFSFVVGLQPWARQELRRQNVEDLQSALALSERLVDFRTSPAYSYKRRGGNRKFGVNSFQGRAKGVGEWEWQLEN